MDDSIAFALAVGIVVVIVFLVAMRPVAAAPPSPQSPRPQTPIVPEVSFDEVGELAERDEARSSLEEDPYKDQSVWELAGERPPSGLTRSSRTLLGNASRVRQSEIGLNHAFEEL